MRASADLDQRVRLTTHASRAWTRSSPGEIRSGASLAFANVVVFRAPPVDAYTVPFDITHTSDRFLTFPEASTVLPPTRVTGPELITVPLMSESPDSEKPDSTRETRASSAGTQRGSDAGFDGAAWG